MVALSLLLCWYGVIVGKYFLLILGIISIWLSTYRYGRRILLWLVLLILFVIIRGRQMFMRQFIVHDECRIRLYSTLSFELSVVGNQVMHVDRHLSGGATRDSNHMNRYGTCRLGLYTLGGIFHRFEYSRRVFIQAILKRFEALGYIKQGQLYVGMFFGANQELDRYFLKQAGLSGIVHVLVVSGYNVSLFTIFADKVLQWLAISVRRVVRFFILVTWLVLVGVEPPILRVFISGVIDLVGQIIGYRFNKDFRWFLLLMAIIYIDPFFIRSLSMQLTLLATWAVVFILEYIENFIVRYWSVIVRVSSKETRLWVLTPWFKAIKSRVARFKIFNIILRDYLFVTSLVNIILMPVFWLNGLGGLQNIGNVLLHNLLLLPVLDLIVPIGYIGFPLLFVSWGSKTFVWLISILYEYVRWIVFL